MTRRYEGPERREKPDQYELIREAVAAGIREAVSDPELWEAAGKAMRAQAQSTAGGWLLGGLSALGKRLALVLAVVAGVYALGGWAAVATLIKGQVPGPH